MWRLAGVLLLTFVQLGSSASGPIGCTGDLYLSYAPPTPANTTTLSIYNPLTKTLTTQGLGVAQKVYNAMAYNHNDSYLYASQNIPVPATNGSIVIIQINSTDAIQNSWTVTGTPFSSNPNTLPSSGDFDAAGNLWIAFAGTTSGVIAKLTGVGSGTPVLAATYTFTNTRFNDFSFDSLDTKLYSFDGQSAQKACLSFDPTTSSGGAITWTKNNCVNTVIAGDPFSNNQCTIFNATIATFFDVYGDFYVFDNSGRIWALPRIQQGQCTPIWQATVQSTNTADGASCIQKPNLPVTPLVCAISGAGGNVVCTANVTNLAFVAEPFDLTATVAPTATLAPWAAPTGYWVSNSLIWTPPSTVSAIGNASSICATGNGGSNTFPYSITGYNTATVTVSNICAPPGTTQFQITACCLAGPVPVFTLSNSTGTTGNRASINGTVTVTVTFSEENLQLITNKVNVHTLTNSITVSSGFQISNPVFSSTGTYTFNVKQTTTTAAQATLSIAAGAVVSNVTGANNQAASFIVYFNITGSLAPTIAPTPAPTFAGPNITTSQSAVITSPWQVGYTITVPFPAQAATVIWAYYTSPAPPAGTGPANADFNTVFAAANNATAVALGEAGNFSAPAGTTTVKLITIHPTRGANDFTPGSCNHWLVAYVYLTATPTARTTQVVPGCTVYPPALFNPKPATSTPNSASISYQPNTASPNPQATILYYKAYFPGSTPPTNGLALSNAVLADQTQHDSAFITGQAGIISFVSSANAVTATLSNLTLGTCANVYAVLEDANFNGSFSGLFSTNVCPSNQSCACNPNLRDCDVCWGEVADNGDGKDSGDSKDGKADPKTATGKDQHDGADWDDSLTPLLGQETTSSLTVTLNEPAGYAVRCIAVTVPQLFDWLQGSDFWTTATTNNQLNNITWTDNGDGKDSGDAKSGKGVTTANLGVAYFVDTTATGASQDVVISGLPSDTNFWVKCGSKSNGTNNVIARGRAATKGNSWWPVPANRWTEVACDCALLDSCHNGLLDWGSEVGVDCGGNCTTACGCNCDPNNEDCTTCNALWLPPALGPKGRTGKGNGAPVNNPGKGKDDGDDSDDGDDTQATSVSGWWSAGPGLTSLTVAFSDTTSNINCAVSSDPWTTLFNNYTNVWNNPTISRPSGGAWNVTVTGLTSGQWYWVGCATTTGAVEGTWTGLWTQVDCTCNQRVGKGKDGGRVGGGSSGKTNGRAPRGKM